jgi:nucleotide-binding universal stress UspA family protein
VGSRGRGGFGSLLLGSVGQRVATLAPSSVVVVRGRRDDAHGPVVVGVDGSPSSLEAMQLGLRTAAGLGVHVVAVRATARPATPADAGALTEASTRDADEEAALRDSIAPLLERHGNVDVELHVAQGGAARALVGLSETARLVVVGSRGHGAVVGSLLGSVGLQLLHHAACPVLVSRGTRGG